jgi:hypothetical protein
LRGGSGAGEGVEKKGERGSRAGRGIDSGGMRQETEGGGAAMVRAVPRRAAKNETTDLRIQDDAERLRVLTREHEGLLDKVARRRAARERMTGEIRAATNAIGAATEELAEEARRLDAEMHAMLERWMAAPRTTKKERDAIRRLYEYLIESGILTPRAFRAEAPRTKAGKRQREEEEEIPEERVAASAARPTGDRGLLRTLYRKLVEALQPDRVQDEEEKAKRTEAMKEVTVAYQAGDFARLVELERSWAEEESVTARGEDREARIEALVNAIGQLKRQLKGLEKDVRAVRATHEWKMTAELKKQSKKGDPIAKVREQANAEVQPLRDTHTHLRRYEQGELTLEELLAGPRRIVDDDDSDGLPLRAEDLEQILAMVAMGARRGKGRARRELDMMSVLEAIGAVLEVRAGGEIGMEEIAEALELLYADLEERLRPRGKGRRALTEEDAHARELFHIVETLSVLAGTMRDMALMERRAAGGRRRR